jgi:hypothetical protein
MRWHTILELMMTGYMRSVPINVARRIWYVGTRGIAPLLVMLLLVSCSVPLPSPEQLPFDVPGLPANLDDLQDLMSELGIPDLSALGDVPGLEALGSLQTPPGGIAFQGPVEMGLTIGETIPGTFMTFVSTTESADGAEFEIGGLHSTRRLGDSLDYDGEWLGMEGMSYHLRLRIYRITDGEVRVAGVHRLVVENIEPQMEPVDTTAHTLRFPHSVTTAAGEQFPGMTLGYTGQDEQGAVLSGLAEDEYPYLKLGDSVEWEGRLRPDVSVEYHLRMLYYQEANATIGGVALVSLRQPARR